MSDPHIDSPFAGPPLPSQELIAIAEPAAIDPRATLRAMRLIRRRTLFNTLKAKFSDSRLRVVLIVFFSTAFWLGLFLVFEDGFAFLNRHRFVTGYLVELLFSLFFGSLLVMLLFSVGIILYTGLFASEEARFLLVRPIPPDHIFAYKFQEALFFSSWGFLLLGSPVIAAYGVTVRATPAFYLVALLLIVSFVLIPASMGALACLLITQLLPRRRRETLIALAVVLIGGAIPLGIRIWRSARGSFFSPSQINDLVEQIDFGNLPFLPSDWISKGLVAATRPDSLTDALFYLLVLLSNGLFFFLLTAACYRVLYRRAYNRLYSDILPRTARRDHWLQGAVEWVFGFLPRPIRALIVKDVRTFLRDPVQRLQVLIFIGLQFVYFTTIGRMSHYMENAYWQTLISFFNLTVTGLILAAFTSRFVFPLLSLEGQRFWILGLCPVSRSAILWGKFAFAAGGTLMVTLLLTCLSGFMLRLSLTLMATQLLTMFILCLGISGIAVGLGARFPETAENDPSKIAAGFGGTLNLVLSLVFIMVVVGAMGVPAHFYSITQTVEAGRLEQEFEGLRESAWSIQQYRVGLLVGTSVALVVGAIATWLPMRLGLASFQKREF